MKKILLPTDFSTNSRNAIVYALNLYKEEMTEFTLLHSYDVNGYMEGSNFVPVPNTKSLFAKQQLVEEQLKQFLGNLISRYENSNHRFKTSAGNQPLSAFIYNTVLATESDLIIIGTRGSTSSQNVAFGNNTKKIIKEVTNCPVLAVPSHVTFSKLDEIVFASGFKTVPRQEDFEFIRSLVKQHKSQIKLLYIDNGCGLSPGQEKNKQLIFSLLEDTPVSYHSLSYVSKPVGIYCFTESRNSDLLVLINRKHSFIENILFDPLSAHVGNYATLPVLVIQRD